MRSESWSVSRIAVAVRSEKSWVWSPDPADGGTVNFASTVKEAEVGTRRCFRRSDASTLPCYGLIGTLMPMGAAPRETARAPSLAPTVRTNVLTMSSA
jgi:hypothetical protein